MKKEAPLLKGRSFGKRFTCPRCGGRNMIYLQRFRHHLCRTCGQHFQVDFDKEVVTMLDMEAGK